jgi:hypothetical protein
MTQFNLNYFLRGPISKYSHTGGWLYSSRVSGSRDTHERGGCSSWVRRAGYGCKTEEMNLFSPSPKHLEIYQLLSMGLRLESPIVKSSENYWVQIKAESPLLSWEEYIHSEPEFTIGRWYHAAVYTAPRLGVTRAPCLPVTTSHKQ